MSLLAELQQVLDREIPMCRHMGIRVVDCAQGAEGGLRLAMPLEGNHNHQQTAFAGSLNSLCTLAGWGATWLELRRLPNDGADDLGAIVIRRSTCKYQSPVTAKEVVARCAPPTDEARAHFAEMLLEKGQAKLDLTIEVPGPSDRPAVLLTGSYVVLPPGEPAGA